MTAPIDRLAGSAVSLDALGKGQSFSFTLPHAGEGESGTWSVMFNAVSTR